MFVKSVEGLEREIRRERESKWTFERNNSAVKRTTTRTISRRVGGARDIEQHR